MAVTYGLTSAGFVAKSQQQIISELQASIVSVFGANVNFGPESNFGQLVGIFSEREALLWQLAEAVYASQYPGGAEGTSVDNILALNNMRRALSKPTRTDPTPVTEANGITEYGLVLFGTPGTTILAGSIIQTTASPPLQFTLDQAVTILAAVNAQQGLYLSNAPTQGAMTLRIVDSAGNPLTTPAIPWNSLPQVTQLKFASVPSAGSFTLGLSSAGATLVTGAIAFSAVAADVQAAIQALAGYSGVTVSGSFSAGFQVSWNGISNPLTTFSTNTLGVVSTVLDSIQAAINTLHDTVAGNYPYTDVVVTTGSSGYVITFGSGTLVSGQPNSKSTSEALFTVVSNSLQMGSNVTNISLANTAQGAPAQGVGTATCIAKGPNFVAAKALSVIGSSVTGWTGVTNQLDCITGSAAEDDTQALVRRQNNLQANANGPLASIVEKVLQIQNVVAAIGFENLNEAALQVLTFSSVPSSGTFELVLNGTPTSALPFDASSAQIQAALRMVAGFSATLVTGSVVAGFTVDFNGSFGGQPVALMNVAANSTGVTITPSFGRPGKSFEIVAEGGASQTIAQTILNSKPAGIQTYGSTTVEVFDAFSNPYEIEFSRPTPVPIYVSIVLQTDLGAASPKFNPQAIANIQQDIVAIGNAVSIGGLIIGFGTEGLIGAFNSVLGIISYTMFFGRSPNPTTNTNIQMQPEEVPVFETFNIAVSYT
jgi:hypothetical protein